MTERIPGPRAGDEYVVARRAFPTELRWSPPDFHSTQTDYSLDDARRDYDAGHIEMATGRETGNGVVTERIYAIPRRVRATPRRYFGGHRP